MKRVLAVVVFVMLIATSAFAETNGQQQSNNDINRVTGNQAITTVTTRIASVASMGTQVRGPQVAQLDAKGNFSFSANAQDMGLSSGDDAANIGIWGMGSYINFQSDASGAKYDADYYSAFVGADWKAMPELLIGLAGGYGYLDLDKDNWGGTDDGTLKTEYELTVMPYAAYNITDTTILDGAFAYTSSRYKDDDGTNTGHYDSERLLTSLGLTQNYAIDAWNMSARLAYIYLDGDTSSYSRGGTSIADTGSYLGQASLEGKVAYLFNIGLEPYFGMKYAYDVQTSTTPNGSDYDEFEGVLGTNWYANDDLTFSLEAGSTMGREDFEAYRGQLFVRYEF